jgi:hypothetical protein
MVSGAKRGIDVASSTRLCRGRKPSRFAFPEGDAYRLGGFPDVGYSISREVDLSCPLSPPDIARSGRGSYPSAGNRELLVAKLRRSRALRT